jgi:hypothetical protein
VSASAPSVEVVLPNGLLVRATAGTREVRKCPVRTVLTEHPEGVCNGHAGVVAC